MLKPTERNLCEEVTKSPPSNVQESSDTQDEQDNPLFSTETRETKPSLPFTPAWLFLLLPLPVVTSPSLANP